MASKRANGEGSWADVKINGKSYKRYREPGGKMFYGKTKTEATAKYKKWLNGTTESVKKNVTVYSIAKEWLAQKEKHIKATTYDGYEYFVESTLKYDAKVAIWYVDPELMTKNRIQLWIDSLADTHPKSTIQKTKGLLKQVLDYAVENGYMVSNPMSNNAIKMPSDEHIKKEAKPPVFLSASDRKKLEDEEERMKHDRHVHYGIAPKVIVFLLHTGLRFGEVTALKWKNVDLHNRRITIAENAPVVKNRTGDGPKYIIKETTVKRKASERIVPLSNKALEILTGIFLDSDKTGDDDLVFKNRNGNPINRRNVNRCLLGMLKSAGCEIQDASAHDLRHSFGSELIRQKTDIKVVSELMGHKDIQTTYNIYIHILQEQKASAVTLFD